jgi:CubicO group peptidase (beta-lactamase class C family)
MPDLRLFASLLIATCVCACACASTVSQAEKVSESSTARRIDASTIARTVDPIIEAEMARSGGPGAAFVFVQDGHILYSKGFGVARVGGPPVDPRTTLWPIASITKTLTALAALQLVDRGHVRLDTDVNLYLRRLKVPSGGFAPLTLRHLLSHTAGLDELPGRQTDGVSPPDLAGFLAPRLKRYRAPGNLTAYSTYGIFLAGVMIEDVSGTPYPRYLRENLFEPLGMRSARVIQVRSDAAGLATPYALEDGQAREQLHEYYASTPASSVAATAEDMGRLIIFHLGGRGAASRILSSRTLRLMHRTQATNHPAVPGWSLGMQMDRVNGLDVAEHGGDIGGFSTLLSIVPSTGQGFFVVSHGEGSDLRFAIRDALLNAISPRGPAPTQLRRSPVPLALYAGRYVSSMSCRSCPDSQRQYFDLTITSDGALDFWGQKWRPAGRDLFVQEDGRRLLGFARDRSGRIVSVTAGSWRVADRVSD